VLTDRRWGSARLLVQVAMIMLGLMAIAAVRSAGDFAPDRPLTWAMAIGLPAAIIGFVALYLRMTFRVRTSS